MKTPSSGLLQSRLLPSLAVVLSFLLAVPFALAEEAEEEAAPKQVVVPAGTILLVRMQSGISSNDKPGTRFACNLESPLYADDGQTVVVPQGSTIYGRVTQSASAGRLAGKSQLELALTEVSLNNRLVPLVTTSYIDAGKGSFRKTARNAAVGAAIGEIASDDAATGAAIGVGVSALRKGESVGVQPGAILEFRLSAPLHTTI